MDDGGAGVEVGEVGVPQILLRAALLGLMSFLFALFHFQARDAGVYGEGIRVDRFSLVIHFRRIVQRKAFRISPGIAEVQRLFA